MAHELAHALANCGETAEAIVLFRDLARLRPGYGLHLICLGRVLRTVGRADEAGAECRRGGRRLACRDSGGLPMRRAYNNLGQALADQGKVEEAEAAYREAIRLNPDAAAVHATSATS